MLQKTRAIVAPSINEKGNPPGESMAAGYSDGSVRVFSSESGRWSERKMKPHGSPVTKLTFSADGQSEILLCYSSVCIYIRHCIAGILYG